MNAIYNRKKNTTLKNVCLTIVSGIVISVFFIIIIGLNIYADELNISRIQSVSENGVCYCVKEDVEGSVVFLPANVENVEIFYTGAVSENSAGTLREDINRIILSGSEIIDDLELDIKYDDLSEQKLIFKKSNLPCVNIELNNVTLATINAGSKDIKYNGNTISIFDPSKPSKINRFQDVEMKGRGNSTWSYLKKPYQLKLSSKQSVLGMDKAKKWLLIANYADETAMKNALSLDIAREIGLPFTPEYRYVDLFVDGQYQGNYLICEKVEVGSNRVELTSEEGILVELDDVYGTREDIFFKIGNQVYVLADSKADDCDDENSVALKAFVEFEAYLRELDALIHAENKEWNAIASMIDVESFLQMYFMQEYSVELDTCLTSFYMYKDGPEDVLHLGPAWDYDKAYNNREASLSADKDYLKYLQSYFRNYGSDWYPELCKIPEFERLLKKYYQTHIKEIFETTSSKIADYKQLNLTSQKMNYIIWPKDYRGLDYDYDTQVDNLLTWTDQRLAYFDTRYQYDSSKLGHVEAKQPTCVRDGNIEYWTEIATDDELLYFDDENTFHGINIDNTVVPAIGHTLIHNESVSSNCITHGKKEFWQCETCGDYFLDESASSSVSENDLILPYGDHEYETVVNEPTCTVSGGSVHTCKNDGFSYIDNVVEKLGHNWDEGTITQQATTDKTGTKVFKCSRCAETKTEIIPKLTAPNHVVPEKKKVINVGTQYVDEDTKAEYKVISTSDGEKQVEYVSSCDNKKKSIIIPNEIVIDGEKYEVTQIAANVFKNNKKIERVTIGKNVTEIGKKTFYNCSKLKKVTLKTKRLKSVGASAFKKIANKSTIKLPKSKAKVYKKLLTNKYTANRTRID